MSNYKIYSVKLLLVPVLIFSCQNIITPQQSFKIIGNDTLTTFYNNMPLRLLPYTKVFTGTQAIVFKEIYGDSVSFEPLPGPTGGLITDIAYDSATGYLFVSTHGEVYRSTDQGMHWELNIFPSQKHNYVRLVKVIAPGIVTAETDFGVFISTNYGGSWEWLYEDLVGFEVESNGIIYAGSKRSGARRSSDSCRSWHTFALADRPIWRVVHCEENKIVCPSDSGFYFSSDGGEEWAFRKYDTPYTWDLVSDRKGNLFVLKYFEHQLFSLHRSNNFGESWYPVHLPVTGDVEGIYLDKDQNVYVTVGDYILMSSDAGGEWETIYFPYGYISTIGWDAAGHFLAACQDGIYRRIEKENKWEQISYGIHARRIENILFPDDNSILVVSLQECFKSTDNGSSWIKTKPVSSANINHYPAALKSSSGNIFLTASSYDYSNSGFVRSTDHGITWEPINVLSNRYNIEGVAETPGGEIYAAAHCADIYRSSDQGETWTQVYTGKFGENINGLAADNKGNIFALKDSAILISGNGVNWMEIKFKREQSNGWESISFDNSGNAWLGTIGNGMYLSSDSGKTWNSVNEGLNKFVISTASDNIGNVAVGTSTGPYLLKDSVNAWTAYRKNFPVTFTTAVAISPDGILYAGTQDFGVYRSTVPLKERIAPVPPDTTSSDTTLIVISNHKIFQNYPNPFNNTTVISWQQPVSRHVLITIYDILGREVDVVANAFFNAGYYEVNYEATALTSGIYIINFRIGDYTDSKKMILIK